MTLSLRAGPFDLDGALLDTAPNGYLESALDVLRRLDAGGRI
jgi:hypothetical protein